MIEINFLNSKKTQKHKIRYTLYLSLIGLLIAILCNLPFNHPHKQTKKMAMSLSTASPDQPCINKHCLLKNHAISELNLIGILIGNLRQWAFVVDSNNVITKIQIGDLIGNTHMQVEKILPTHITLIDPNDRKKGKTILRISL